MGEISKVFLVFNIFLVSHLVHGQPFNTTSSSTTICQNGTDSSSSYFNPCIVYNWMSSLFGVARTTGDVLEEVGPYVGLHPYSVDNSRTRWTMLERNLMILLLRAMSLFKNLFLKSGTSSTPDWRTSQVLLTIFWSRWIRSLRPTGLTSRSSSAL